MRSRVDWGPQLVYWVEDGKQDPDVDWPHNWEVCGYPQCNPLAVREEDKRKGQICLAMPMYAVADLTPELEHICSFLERMPEVESEKWLALQDRQLTCSCSDPETEAAEMDRQGFHIPGPIVRRIRALRLRLMIGLHPASDVISQVIY